MFFVPESELTIDPEDIAALRTEIKELRREMMELRQELQNGIHNIGAMPIYDTVARQPSRSLEIIDLEDEL